MNNFFIEPPTGLFEKIINRIHKEEHILTFKKVLLFSIIIMVCLMGLLPASNALLRSYQLNKNYQALVQFKSYIAQENQNDFLLSGVLPKKEKNITLGLQNSQSKNIFYLADNTYARSIQLK